MKDNGIVMQIDGISKSYGSNEVLKNISLTISRGDVIAIIGPSGCGKSTFIRMLNLLERPTSGKIFFENQELTALPPNRLMDIIPRIGMVFQQFNLFRNLTVKQNITLAPVLHRLCTQKEAENLALKMLERFDLAGHADKYPAQLSGGQQQRVSIIRTIAMKPALVLFDEPTSALDPEMVGEVLGMMKELAEEGMTMAVVTHEMKFARKVSNRVLFFDNQGIQEQGTPDEVFDNPRDPRLREFLSKISS
ncbi:amino acid ABC transporter ATP-binding protein [Succinimonas amylolytica]|uniref:amino acid ABC transporter ATP-binding protein n=1 Tax=Succinimonas amylolytica TaxID=83769 RepID=UPI0003807C7B|nr:amino acid ABC transporter ATP-binding protein [Succinimonas amylolytica]